MGAVCFTRWAARSVTAFPAPDPHPHPLAGRIAKAVVQRVLGIASADTLAWERALVADDPQARRLAHRIERRARWLLAHAEDPIAQFERLADRTLAWPCDPDRPTDERSG